jgi:hypothetical protein
VGVLWLFEILCFFLFGWLGKKNPKKTPRNFAAGKIAFDPPIILK